MLGPIFENALNIRQVAGVSFDCQAERVVNPILRVVALKLAQSFCSHWRYHTDILLIKQEDIGPFFFEPHYNVVDIVYEAAEIAFAQSFDSLTPFG